MKKLSNFLSNLALCFSILLLSYIFYKSEIVYSGAKFHYYLKYYLFSLLLIILAIFSYFLKKEIKVKIILILFSSLLGLYLVEGILTVNHIFFKAKMEKTYRKEIKEMKSNYDTRTKLQVYEDLKRDDPKVTLYVSPTNFIDDSDQTILPLSSISNTKTIFCNENGYYSIYQSDRYGFNNPDDEWDKEQIEFLLVGDSFTQGACVNEPDTIGGNLRRILRTKNGIINLGHGGYGPLTEYATLREYMPLINTKKVLWIYYEANDLFNLSKELKNEILLNYLNDQHFTQNLKLKQDKIDTKLNEKFLEELNLKLDRQLLEKQAVEEINFLHFLKMYKIRKITIENFFSSPDPKFMKILNLAKEFVESSGAKLYFVYLPESARYKDKLFLQDKSRKYKKVIKIIENLEIPIIDLNKDLFQKHNDPLSLFPLRAFNHYNEEGYRLASEVILNKIN